ncbi:required for excision 1-B domain-containing protein isoform X3 [Mixophyes fleayi]|uniref:required for excision 1-B domain-containing protein isoform X3 n=1 Tax=Mixophyes fleayi TaxID=3061075 RepID=UPI003F4DAB9D
MTDNDFRLLIQRFYELQAERVDTYHLFEEGHQAYLKSGPHYDFIQYRQLVHEITQAFNGISKELIQMKDRFREFYDRPDLSEHLEKIQELEKEKLELIDSYRSLFLSYQTARLQLAKQNAQDHPSQACHQEEVQLLKHKIIKTVEAISEVLQDFKYDCEEIQ